MKRGDLLLILVFLSTVGSAWAAGTTLQSAEQAFAELSIDRAATLYNRALNEPGTRTDRLAALRGLGLAEAFRGQAKAARVAFEQLLILDPQANIESSLGPKVVRPFEQARAATAGKKNTLTISRDDTGAVTATLSEEVRLAKKVTLYVRARGTIAFLSSTAPADQPLSSAFAPEEDVEAFAEGTDGKKGVLYEHGREDSPLLLPAVILPSPRPIAQPSVPYLKPPPDRTVADEKAGLFTGAEPSEFDPVPKKSSSHWPLVVGIAAVVGAGVVAGIVLAQPPMLVLPPADRTSQLP